MNANLPNIEESNQELALLNEEIEKLKNQIAERESMYQDVPVPQTRVGWASYIANNDRGLLDKYQDAERQWYTLKENAKNARELADKQRAQQDLMTMDENMLKRSLAAINYQYALQERKSYTGGDEDVIRQLEHKEAVAKATLDYWNTRTGMNVAEKPKDEPKNPESPEKNPESPGKNKRHLGVLITDLKNITSISTEEEKAKIKRDLESDPDIVKNPELKNQYNRIAKIITKETADKKKAAELAELQREFDGLRSPIEKRLWLNKHPKVESNMGEIQWRK